MSRLRSYHGQMSESFVVGILLSLCGGFQDAYTYVCRDKVFANAQTGNIVLLGNHLAQGEWASAARYAVPVAAFAAGIFLAQKIRFRFGRNEGMHWRQLVLLLEIASLLIAGFIPAGMSLPANALISFSCAMQVDSFKKIRGNAMATTMCIGNLRSATDLLCAYTETKDRKLRQKSLQYYFFIFVFACGATLGGLVTRLIGVRAVWICAAGLMVSFLILFIREEALDLEKLEEDPKLREEIGTFTDELRDIGREIRRCLRGK
ncbi:MAG: YoaK family protein [Eubacteriales bacterium]|nr:YoaK family protein [Eubacteriales bacterium]